MQKLELSPQQIEKAVAPGSALARHYCQELETGRILFFPVSPVSLPEEDLHFLLGRQQVGDSFHKNISYRPGQDRLTGLAGGERVHPRVKEIMKAFSLAAVRFLEGLLRPYAAAWHVDFASFRPIEEQGRIIKEKARSDLLHVDAFPTRPTRGNRILRFFVNLNPEISRRWITGDPFDMIVKQYAGPGGMPLPCPTEPWRDRARRGLMAWAHFFGLPVPARSRYDEFMLGFHDYLKQNREFQSEGARYHWEFPPGSAWMVFTDMVPHAAESGRFAVEQTLIVSRESLLSQEKAPIHILEKLAGTRLA